MPGVHIEASILLITLLLLLLSYLMSAALPHTWLWPMLTSASTRAGPGHAAHARQALLPEYGRAITRPFCALVSIARLGVDTQDLSLT